MNDELKSPQEQETSADYLRILSHQLQAPITTIQMILKTIAEGFTGEVNQQTLHFIQKAIHRTAEAKDMIADLINYELYAQVQPTAREDFDLVALLKTVVNPYAVRAAEKQISLRTELPLRLQVIMSGDHRGLEHAFSNLIENALKYTPEQGQVTVTLHVTEADNSCQISVCDTGYGIPSDELDRIFEPFFRSAKHKAHIAGTGLGLPIVKRILTSYHGTITVTSQENVGTTFTVTLPDIHLRPIIQPVTERKKVVIIGGVTSGPKAAARLRRLDEQLDITIIEKGEFLSYSGCGLPAYIADRVQSPKALMSSADDTIQDIHFFETIKNITILNHTVVIAINRDQKTVTIQDLNKSMTAELPYDVLILATGTEFNVPDIPGIRQEGIYSLHSLEEAKAIKREFFRNNAQDVCIIGGGLIGTSLAESLIAMGARVTILEKQPSILFDLMDQDIALKIQQELHKKGVKILTNEHITAIEKRDDHFMILTANKTYSADLILLATGVKPNVTLARAAGLAIGASGGIRVTSALRTSDEQIYAVGDCAESVNLLTQQHEYWPLGAVSTKMGRIAADNICDRPTEFQGSIGTAMFRIIDINVARTGLTLKRSQERGFHPEAVVVTGLDRAHFAEHPHYMTLKVIADRDTKVILGAQGYGKGDVVAKIQLLACAMTQRFTLDDVFKLDLGYAPLFNTAIDFVQTACVVLNNKIEHLFRTITLEEFEREQQQLKGIIDVSPLAEYTFHSIPGSLNIPLEHLRREDIPFEKDAEIVLYSKTSARAYQAYRYLISQGYVNLRVLEGGYVYWER